MSGSPTPAPDDSPRTELLLSLPALRARLEEQRQFRIEQIASLSGDGSPAAVRPVADPAATDPSAVGSTARPPVVDPPVDSAQSQVSAALLAGARQALADIETALYRILNGQYGTCLDCGSPIDMQRLRTLPQTALCADCHRARTADPARPADRTPPRPPDRAPPRPARSASGSTPRRRTRRPAGTRP